MIFVIFATRKCSYLRAMLGTTHGDQRKRERDSHEVELPAPRSVRIGVGRRRAMRRLADASAVVSTLDKLAVWSRSGSLSPMTFGLACRTIEMTEACGDEIFSPPGTISRIENFTSDFGTIVTMYCSDGGEGAPGAATGPSSP